MQGRPIIISKARNLLTPPKLVRKKKQGYILVLLLIFFCFKKEVTEAQTPQDMVSPSGQVQKDASRRTFRLDYRLDPRKTKETGVFLSPDSVALISPGKDAWYQPGSYHQAVRAFQVDFEGLEPYNRYFYRFFIKDRQNRIAWSEITPTFTPGFNIRWTGAQKWITASNTIEIMLAGESVDTDRRQYQVFYSGLACELIKITSSPESAKSFYTIRLPRHAPMGRHRLVMTYKQKRIFEENIDVL